jgi:hypothetical protein
VASLLNFARWATAQASIVMEMINGGPLRPSLTASAVQAPPARVPDPTLQRSDRSRTEESQTRLLTIAHGQKEGQAGLYFDGKLPLELFLQVVSHTVRF